MFSTAQSASDRKFWLQWLNKYKSLRLLWDADEKAHSNREQRNAAYEELVEMAKVVAPDADTLFVRNRISSFRTCFRREGKKVQAAKANGTIYKPTLFYYETMKFLDPDNDDFETHTSTWDSIYSDDEDPFSNVSATKLPVQEPKPVPKRRIEEKKSYKVDLAKSDEGESSDDTTASTIPKIKRFKMDEYEILGQRIAAHFRKMDEEQCLIAEKIMSEVCFYGRMKALTIQTGLTVEVPALSPTITRPRRTLRGNDPPRNNNNGAIYEEECFETG